MLMPENIVIDIVETTQETFASFWPVLLVMFSLPVSFYIIKKIIQLVPKR